MAIAGHIMVTLYRKTFLFIELKAFDLSTSRTASQVWSLYITRIACMMDSQAVYCPAQTWRDPTDVIMPVRMCVTTALPTMRRSTSPTPITQSPEFLSSGISRQARKASNLGDWFFKLQIFLMTWAKALRRTLCKSFIQIVLMLKYFFNHLSPCLKVLHHLASLLQHFVSFLRRYLRIYWVGIGLLYMVAVFPEKLLSLLFVLL